MALTGRLFIGAKRVTTDAAFSAIDPATGDPLAPAFSAAGPAEATQACALAAEAFRAFEQAGPEKRARLLERIAANIDALGDGLLERARFETGLPLARLAGERARTVYQLKLFAAELRDGACMGVQIDPALPERQPAPRRDVRMRKKPLGPVVVFGASNFPLAFSVAGGDTASALAAGCPVIAKGHPAHPGVCELVAGAVADAVAALELPEGVFSMLNSPHHDLGQALVADPRVKAAAFTGSRQGGLALMRIAQAREEPIPVYAEMSAVNPVILLPGALEEQAEKLGRDFVASLTLGAGQFCTNPGLVLAIQSPRLDRFVEAARKAVEESPPQTMLTPAIHQAYEEGLSRLSSIAEVATVACGAEADGNNLCRPAFFSISVDDFIRNKVISQEVFGASSVLVRCRDAAAFAKALESLEGQLTVTMHFVEKDLATAKALLPLLEEKAGRLIANGWPTGVEVCHAMVHGGPFPATSDSRTTSVGALAIERFLRPVCYQDFPRTLLPAMLRENGPAGVLRRIDGVWKID
ncbi:aldehyde dehydrogenase (NADP(+)) [Amphiplicatus metriothermophilus]|uniref:NADP-dependent aldehyde dehydrogenase n=1 Tax=Amphiplicatus metriothermophilus TaxID=1519374 RepID=A0A239PY31_9PROT|nr:aldehyde dehydrogenase (NADP(+)) [Amphiplicatus metriothermophilus]MBB5519801.1 NADP-dependent aldehyde dehydrogenase [Amphiplicatus metriothermophilus]SNT75165.1 NADP-dependent aldehyde dehydrogenase [Amphiplicatus metriothermophilus]